MSTISGKDPEKLDWFEMYPEPFFGGAEDYDFEVRGAYALVLFMIYASRRGRLPDEPAKNARKMGLSTRKWNEAKARLIADGKIQLENGHLTNRKATAYFDAKLPIVTDNRRKLAEKARDKQGEKQGEKPALNFPPKSDQGLSGDKTPKKAPYTRAQESESESELESTVGLGDVIIHVQAIADALGQDRGKYWETDYRRLIDEGLSPEALLEAAKAHRGGPIRSLNALRGLAQRKQEDMVWTQRQAPASTPPAQITRQDWETALRNLLQAGAWDENATGIVPTRPGHSVPPELYATWLKLWKLQGEHPIQEFDRSGNLVKYPADPQAVSQTFRALWEPLP